MISMTMSAWGAAACAPLGVLGATQVAVHLIDRIFAARYERARADATVRLLQRADSGISILDQRSDGTMLSVIRAADSAAICCNGEEPGGRVEPCE